MLHDAVLCRVIALTGAILSFDGIAGDAVEIAQILFGIFAIMAIVSLYSACSGGAEAPSPPVTFCLPAASVFHSQFSLIKDLP